MRPRPASHKPSGGSSFRTAQRFTLVWLSRIYYIFFTDFKKQGGSEFDCIFFVYIFLVWTNFDDTFLLERGIEICRNYFTSKGGNLGDDSGLMNFTHFPLTYCNEIWHRGVILMKIKFIELM